MGVLTKDVIDPKKLKHFYVDGSYDPNTGIAGIAVLVKGYGFKPYTITKQYKNSKCSSTYAEHMAIKSAIKEAKEQEYDMSHVIIYTDQEQIVNGVGEYGRKKKKKINNIGIKLEYLPSTHYITSYSTKRRKNAYVVNELAKSATQQTVNRYNLHWNKKKRKSFHRKED